MNDIVKVLLVTTIGITISQIEVALTIVSLSLAISYTVWKWSRDIKKPKKK